MTISWLATLTAADATSSDKAFAYIPKRVGKQWLRGAKANHIFFWKREKTKINTSIADYWDVVWETSLEDFKFFMDKLNLTHNKHYRTIVQQHDVVWERKGCHQRVGGKTVAFPGWKILSFTNHSSQWIIIHNANIMWTFRNTAVLITIKSWLFSCLRSMNISCLHKQTVLCFDSKHSSYAFQTSLKKRHCWWFTAANYGVGSLAACDSTIVKWMDTSVYNDRDTLWETSALKGIVHIKWNNCYGIKIAMYARQVSNAENRYRQ